MGLALVGNRVTLLSIAYTGDLGSGSDTQESPMAEGILTVVELLLKRSTQPCFG